MEKPRDHGFDLVAEGERGKKGMRIRDTVTAWEGWVYLFVKIWEVIGILGKIDHVGLFWCGVITHMDSGYYEQV